MRSYFVHNGRNLYFLALVVGVTLIGALVIVAAWTLARRKYWGQLLLLLLPLAPLVAESRLIATIS